MDAKQALADRLKQANNILVTVSSNPSVDQLAACIGMTLALNKLEKHATAVFSGAVPNIIEFLEPEKTLEKNTDSLRDFIIALDKSKADKLRYKVEDTVVKIFITPYKTSINEKDLEFSQGDFNVDVVLALGVHNQADLDTAITSHGRILHDATVATVNTEPGGELGTVNWLEHDASSLSELAAELVDAIDKEVMDTQIATAFLTGIVAETDRFSNDKTSPMTMTISAELMAAGANQQLVATKLEPPAPKPEEKPQPIEEHKDNRPPQSETPAEPPKPDDGTLEISHVGEPAPGPKPEPTTEGEEKPQPEPMPETHTDSEPKNEPEAQPEPRPEPPLAESTPELERPVEQESATVPQIKIDDQGSLEMHDNLPEPGPKPEIHMDRQHMILRPPTLGSAQMSGGVVPEDEERPAGEPPRSALPTPGLLQRGSSSAAASFPPPAVPFTTMPPTVSAQPAPFTPTVPNSEPPAPVFMTPPVPQPAPSAFQPAPVAAPPAPAGSPFFNPSVPAGPTALPATPAPPVQTLSEIEQNVSSPHLQQFMSPQPGSALPPLPAPTPFTPMPQPPAPAPLPPAPQPVFPPDPIPVPTVPAPQPMAPPVSAPQPAPEAGVDVNTARDAVMHAYDGVDQNEPIEALNAQPLGTPLHESDPGQNGINQGPGTPPAMPPPMVPPTPGV